MPPLSDAGALSGLGEVLDWRQMAQGFAAAEPEALAVTFTRRYVLGQPQDNDGAGLWSGAPALMPATLMRELLDLIASDAVAQGTLTLLNTPIDLGRIAAEIYLLGCRPDRLAPPERVHAAAALFAGRPTRVTAGRGPLNGLMAGPHHPERSHAGHGDGDAPDSIRPWSWWDHWADWLVARGGTPRRARPVPGSPDYPPRRPAPGRNALGALPLA